MSDDHHTRAAEQLWQAWSAGLLLDGIDADVRPHDLDEGYEVQRALDALAGPSVGWKIAATSAAGQQHLGVSGPMVGRLYRSQARIDGARLSVGAMRMRSAEPEFAFRFGRDLVPGAEAPDREQVLDAVQSLVLAIEVPDSRFADFAAAGAPQLIADAMCGGHFVLGREITDWRGLDLPGQRARMLRDGSEASAGSGSGVMGDPADALTWMVGEVLGRGWPLRAGEIVLTGASATPVEVDAGQVVVAEFEGLGTVSVEFVP